MKIPRLICALLILLGLTAAHARAEWMIFFWQRCDFDRLLAGRHAAIGQRHRQRQQFHQRHSLDNRLSGWRLRTLVRFRPTMRVRAWRRTQARRST